MTTKETWFKMLQLTEPLALATDSFEPGTLWLARALVRRLNEASIRYCHWKSNESLAAALAGTGDVDLLVDPADATRFVTVLTELGFQQADQVAWQRQTSIRHYYGLDPSTGKLLHVHVYFRLVTGGQVLKNYRLPFEPLLLDGGARSHGVPVPDQASELLVFVVRKMLEAGSVVELLLQRRDRAHVNRELRWLLPRDDAKRAAVKRNACAALAHHWPALDGATWRAGAEALAPSTSFIRQYLLGRRFRRVCKPLTVRGRLAAASSVAGRLICHMGVRLRHGRMRKWPAAGGQVIAVMGPEASGKSTTVEMLRKWLGGTFAARAVHMGKPRSSWIGRAGRSIRAAMRRIGTWRRGSGRTVARAAAAEGNGRCSYAYAIASVLLARDRYHAAQSAFRDASRGSIVVCDRYPATVVGAVDGPRLFNCRAAGFRGKILACLARLERHYYRHIAPPDFVIQLDVPLDLAKRRNRTRVKRDKECDEYLAVRYDQFQDNQPRHDRIVRVDTRGPKGEVMARIRGIVWRHL